MTATTMSPTALSPTTKTTPFSTSLRVLTRRSLRHSFRDPESVLMAILLPVFLLLIFVYVLGGAMSIESATGGSGTPDRSDYLSYVMPALALTAAGFGASYTGVVVSNDMETGVIDRFRTMPFPAVTVLLGHAISSVIRNLLATGVVLLIAFAVGFRVEGTFLEFLGAVGLIALWIVVITVVFATLGMIAGSAEAASSYGFILLFLPYLSSGFAPVETMPGWLQGFAGHQPMTPLIDASRSLMNGGSTGAAGADAFIAVAWCVAFITLAVAGASYVFPRRTAR